MSETSYSLPGLTEVNNVIVVRSNIRDDDGSHWLTIDCPRGWEDVAPLTTKVLAYQGRNYTFRGWNSDRNECFFRETTEGFATIVGHNPRR